MLEGKLETPPERFGLKRDRLGRRARTLILYNNTRIREINVGGAGATHLGGGAKGRARGSRRDHLLKRTGLLVPNSVYGQGKRFGRSSDLGVSASQRTRETGNRRGFCSDVKIV